MLTEKDTRPYADAFMHDFVQNDWESMHTGHSVADAALFRKWLPDRKLYQYHIRGCHKNVSPELCVAVALDFEYRKTWDKNLVELQPIASTSSAPPNHLTYYTTKFPFPLQNRDAVDYRVAVYYPQHQTTVVMSRCGQHPSYPHHKHRVRLEDYYTVNIFRLASDGKSTEFLYFACHDFKARIPSGIVGWAAKKAIPEFLKHIRVAFDSYLEDKGDTWRNDPRLSAYIHADPAGSSAGHDLRT